MKSLRKDIKPEEIIETIIEIYKEKKSSTIILLGVKITLNKYLLEKCKDNYLIRYAAYNGTLFTPLDSLKLLADTFIDNFGEYFSR